MILVDANLLIYAVNQAAPQHQAAKRWWESALSGTEPVGLAWLVVLAFLRITTRPDIMENPLDMETAISYIEEWLQCPVVEIVVPDETHWQVLRDLLRSSGATGNLTSDAHLAAIAIGKGARIYSADSDFQRFNGVRHNNPL